MNDLYLTCVDCGDEFTFTTAEQRFYAERGIRQPVRCGICRADRRAERNASLIAGYESLSESNRWSEIGSGVGYGLSNGEGGRSRATRGPRQIFHTVCATCGKDTEVPFQPRSGRPIYCKECFNARRGR